MTMFIGTLFFVLATLPTGAISDKVVRVKSSILH